MRKLLSFTLIIILLPMVVSREVKGVILQVVSIERVEINLGS